MLQTKVDSSLSVTTLEVEQSRCLYVLSHFLSWAMCQQSLRLCHFCRGFAKLSKALNPALELEV